ncbi:MAG: hypothetical protein MHPSP_004212 [Paramarteilia canceri]
MHQDLVVGRCGAKVPEHLTRRVLFLAEASHVLGPEFPSPFKSARILVRKTSARMEKSFNSLFCRKCHVVKISAWQKVKSPRPGFLRFECTVCGFEKTKRKPCRK